MVNSSEDRISIIRDTFFQELWNQRNFACADHIFTDDFITESIALEPSNWSSIHGTGPESMKQHIRWWLDILPDAKMSVADIACNANEVISNWELRGTMQKAAFGVVPTNKGLIIYGCTVSLFREDRICLNKTLFDRLGFLQQIKVLPPSGELFKSE
jgi:hypothetical protein